MSREVMQMALDFCEFLWRDVPLNDYSEDMRQDVEAALRAALAEPDEPVAWINAARDVLTSHPESWGRECEGWTPLYTHPAPQRQPLTDEQIKAAALSVPASVYELMHGHEITVEQFQTALADFARAIEAAHGITGEQK